MPLPEVTAPQPADAGEATAHRAPQAAPERAQASVRLVLRVGREVRGALEARRPPAWDLAEAERRALHAEVRVLRAALRRVGRSLGNGWIKPKQEERVQDALLQAGAVVALAPRSRWREAGESLERIVSLVGVIQREIHPFSRPPRDDADALKASRRRALQVLREARREAKRLESMVRSPVAEDSGENSGWSPGETRILATPRKTLEVLRSAGAEIPEEALQELESAPEPLPEPQPEAPSEAGPEGPLPCGGRVRRLVVDAERSQAALDSARERLAPGMDQAAAQALRAALGRALEVTAGGPPELRREEALRIRRVVELQPRDRWRAVEAAARELERAEGEGPFQGALARLKRLAQEIPKDPAPEAVR